MKLACCPTATRREAGLGLTGRPLASVCSPHLDSLDEPGGVSAAVSQHPISGTWLLLEVLGLQSKGPGLSEPGPR